MTTAYDAIVIGTGQAGPSLARRLAKAGMKVAIVERKLFGGTCVNTGCIPTKAMVASAYAAHMARRAADFGVHLIRVQCSSGPEEVCGTHVLLAVGRKPNTDDLGLEQARVKVDERGYVVV